MSGIRVEVNVDDQALRRSMTELAARGRDLRAPLRSIGEAMLRSTDERFRQQRDPQGQPWAPLQPATLANKRNQRILTESGNLRGSINYRVGADRLEVGTPSVYGAIHQLGGEVQQKARTQVSAVTRKGQFKTKKAAGQGKKVTHIRFANIQARVIKMPARPYLGLSSADRERVATILARHLAGGGP